MQLRRAANSGCSFRALLVVVSMLATLTPVGYSQGTSTFDFCWRDTHGRGAGLPLDTNSCADPSLEKDPHGLLCYPKCKPGYHGVGPVCWQDCPGGYTDTGGYCLKPQAYGRGAGYAGGTCPSGFFDPIDGGTCWKCPDDSDGRGGWIRSADSVKSSTACWRAPREKLSHAIVVKRGLAWDCSGDQFWDGRDENQNLNGTCWRCPSDTPRRTANPVWQADACASAIGNQTASAISLGKVQSAIDTCTAQNPAGCEMNGLLAYPKCKPGFHAFGANICTPDCPAGMQDIGVSCQQVSYGRGAGDLLGCPAGTERSGLLCYPKCAATADGVGPTCWDKCPSGWVQCGMGCAQSAGACAQATTDQVVSVVNALAQIAIEVVTAGAASGALEAADEAEAAARDAEKTANTTLRETVSSTSSTQKEIDEAKQAAIKASKEAEDAAAAAKRTEANIKAARTTAEEDLKKLNFTKMLKNQGSLDAKDAQQITLKLVKPDSRQAWAKIGVNAAENTPKLVGGAYDVANNPNLTDDQKNFKIAQTVMDYASMVDPTGVMAIVDAYTKPMCSLVAQVKPNNTVAKGNKVGMAKKSYPIMQGDKDTAGPMSRCTAANPQGCELVGTIAYANCTSGYRDDGLYCDPAGSAPPSEIASKTYNHFPVDRRGAGANVRWTPMVGNALAIGANARGSLWAIGNAPGADHPIYRFNGTSWQLMPGAGTRIAVAPDGNAWVVTSGMAIFRFNGTAWQQLPGGASDIAVGANGSVWVIGGGGAIYRLNVPASSPGPYQWQKMPGGGTRIAVDPEGNAWVVNAGHEIYRYNGTSWERLPGAATAIAIDAGGLAYVVGLDGLVYHWAGTNWTKDGTSGENLAGGAPGVAYVTKSVAEKNAILARATQ